MVAICVAAGVVGSAAPAPAAADATVDRVRFVLPLSQMVGLALSGDGRVAVFSTFEPFASDDTNGVMDVYALDLASGALERISVSSEGLQGVRDGAFSPVSAGADVSFDGRLVAFFSYASGLDPTDRNRAGDVFIRDRLLGTTTLVSRNTAGEPQTGVVTRNGSAISSEINTPLLSADGNVVAWRSHSPNLVPDDTNESPDIFVRDLRSGVTVRASVDSAGDEGTPGGIDGQFTFPEAISGDGIRVLFRTTWRLHSDDDDTRQDAYVHDLRTRETFLVTRTASGRNVDDSSGGGTDIDSSGKRVLFVSMSDAYAPVDELDPYDLDTFMHEVDSRRTVRLTGVGETGAHVDESSGELGLARLRGDVLLYSSTADDRYQLFGRDVRTGRRELISVTPDGHPFNHGISLFDSSEDGSRTIVYTHSTNLDPRGRAGLVLIERGWDPHAVGLRADRDGSAVRVRGTLRFGTETLATTGDAPGDASGDADIISAAVDYQADPGLVRFRVSVRQLTVVSGTDTLGVSAAAVSERPAHLPGSYRMTFAVGGSPITVETAAQDDPLRVSSTAGPGATRPFRLVCSSPCTSRSLAGSIGAAGHEVVVTVPLATLGVAEGVTLEAIRVAATGPTAGDEDGVDLGAVRIPEARAEYASGPAGTDAGSWEPLPATAGLSLVLEDNPDAVSVWVRACLGSTCGIRQVTA